MKWIPDSDAERVLEEECVKHEQKMVPATEIDLEKSTRFNVREVPAGKGLGVDPTRVDRLIRCVESGRPFKRVVLLSPSGSNRKHLVLGGMHRLKAFSAKNVDPVGAYVITSDDVSKVNCVARRLNLDIGLEVSDDFAAIQAVDQITNFGMSISEASRKFCVGKAVLERLIHAREVSDKAESWGIRVNGAASTTLEKLYQFRNQEPVLRKILSVVSEQDASVKHVDDIARLVKDKRSEADKISAVESYARDVLEPPKEVGVKTVRSPKSRIKSYANGLLNLIGDKKTFRSLGLTGSEDIPLLEAFVKLGKRLLQIAKEAKVPR